MKDNFGREINYIRISVTDRCNLRCRYCMPPEGTGLVGCDSLLTYGEIIRIADICGRIGISNIRVTGGEPLVRKGIADLIGDLKTLPSARRIAMTTNGVLLPEMLEELAKKGLDGLNISLDTLNREKYKELTGKDCMERVLSGIKRASEMGVFLVKTNTVLIDGFNDDEAADIAGLALDDDITVRFIEMMPMGLGKKYKGVSGDKVKKMLTKAYGNPEIVEAGQEQVQPITGSGFGPAVYYRFPGLKGNIGLINPVSQSFCGQCNKLRLTAEGKLKPCLQYEGGFDLKKALRRGCSDEDIEEMIKLAISSKPACHHFECTQVPGGEKNLMSQIGG